jgi:hypothetical protein
MFTSGFGCKEKKTANPSILFLLFIQKERNTKGVTSVCFVQTLRLLRPNPSASMVHLRRSSPSAAAGAHPFPCRKVHSPLHSFIFLCFVLVLFMFKSILLPSFIFLLQHMNLGMVLLILRFGLSGF